MRLVASGAEKLFMGGVAARSKSCRANESGRREARRLRLQSHQSSRWSTFPQHENAEH